MIALRKKSLGQTHVETELEGGAPYKIFKGALWKTGCVYSMANSRL